MGWDVLSISNVIRNFWRMDRGTLGLEKGEDVSFVDAGSFIVGVVKCGVFLRAPVSSRDQTTPEYPTVEA